MPKWQREPVTKPRGFNTYLEWDRGFHGWLIVWFLTTVLALAGHVVNMLRVGRMGPVWWSTAGAHVWFFRISAVVDVIWVVAVFVALVYGLALFLDEDKATPRFWTRYFVTIAIVGSALYLFHSYRMARWQDVPVAMILRQKPWSPVLSAALSIVWALYWSRSKRVRNTYRA